MTVGIQDLAASPSRWKLHHHKTTYIAIEILLPDDVGDMDIIRQVQACRHQPDHLQTSSVFSCWMQAPHPSYEEVSHPHHPSRKAARPSHPHQPTQ